MGLWVPKIINPKSKGFGCRISAELQDDLNSVREEAKAFGERPDVSGAVERALHKFVAACRRDLKNRAEAEEKRQGDPVVDDGVGEGPVDQYSHAAIPDHDAT